jgi:hypothetical protein
VGDMERRHLFWQRGSRDQTKSLMVYLEGWRSLSGGTYGGSELLFVYTDGLGSGTLNQISAR